MAAHASEKARRTGTFHCKSPIAVAAIYDASLMEHRLEQPIVWHMVSLLICTSVIAHGVMGAPGTRLYGRAVGKRSGAA